MTLNTSVPVADQAFSVFNTPSSDYWPTPVSDQLRTQHWSHVQISDRIDLAAWQTHLADLPRDPYVDQRWKRMSWLTVTKDGDVVVMGECPMAQGGAFNDAETMADRLRYYAPLTEAFLARQDVQDFVREWAKLWGIAPNEPILMQLNGVRGETLLDPLQGQGIHADGCTALSILVINRENVSGGENHLYADRAGTQPLQDIIMKPGEVMHLCDDKLYHSVDPMCQEDPDKPFERFVVIINTRFVDDFQNFILRRHFPDAVLHGTR